jgi:multiple sugar transport system permease protein
MRSHDYVIPMSFLAIPFYGIMGNMAMTDNPLAVIAVEVTFATPYAIFIFQQYGARFPSSSTRQRASTAPHTANYFLIYLPLMRRRWWRSAPTPVAVVERIPLRVLAAFD